MTTTVNFEFPHERSPGGCTVYQTEKQTCLVANAWSPGFWESTVDQEVDIQASEGKTPLGLLSKQKNKSYNL